MTKMGFKIWETPLMSYGRTGTVLIAGKEYRYASDAERRWLEHMEPALLDRKVKLVWQPEPFSLTYKHCQQECKDTYRPDARLIWIDTGEEWYIEIKRGALHQKSASKMKRFCQQYPEKKFVLVWFGSLPKKGVAHRRLEALEPHLDHIWRMK